MTQGWTLAELATATATTVRGNAERRVQAVAPFEQAQAADISYVRDPKYARLLPSSQAGALILTPDMAEAYQGDALLSHNPYLSYARLVNFMHPLQRPEPGVHPTAVLADDVQLGAAVAIGPQAVIEAGAVLEEGVVVGAGCYIGADVCIGANSFLYPNVTLAAATELGQRAIIHSGTVLGSDGFGFVPDATGWYKIPQVGRVCVGDDVEIGANTSIDRAAMGETYLGNGVKLDNLIHIAHNVHIGDHTVIAACTGIAGSARIGQHCQISGMCSIAGHLTIADHVTLTGTSFVINSITQPGVYSSGIPIEEHALWRKNTVRVRQLDKLTRRINALEKQLADLKNSSL